jgi:hypothetical protein
MKLTLTREQLAADYEASKKVRQIFKAKWTRSGAVHAGYWHLDIGGWVHHCGHPTALWPYYGETRHGRSIVAPSGRGFRLLLDAQIAVFCESLKDIRTELSN